MNVSLSRQGVAWKSDTGAPPVWVVPNDGERLFGGLELYKEGYSGDV